METFNWTWVVVGALLSVAIVIKSVVDRMCVHKWNGVGQPRPKYGWNAMLGKNTDLPVCHIHALKCELCGKLKFVVEGKEE